MIGRVCVVCQEIHWNVIALEGASSVGGLLITTEAMVADKPEEKCGCNQPPLFKTLLTSTWPAG